MTSTSPLVQQRFTVPGSTAIRLNRLVDCSVLALDTRLDEHRMTQNHNEAGPENPKEGAERGEIQAKRDADTEERRVQMLLRDGVLSDLCCLRRCFIVRTR